MNTAAAFDLQPYTTSVDPGPLAAWNAKNARARMEHLRDPFRASRELALLDARGAYSRGDITRAQYRAEVEEVAVWRMTEGEDIDIHPDCPQHGEAHPPRRRPHDRR